MTKLRDNLGTKDRPKPAVIGGTVVIEGGAGIVAGYPRAIDVVLLREPLPNRIIGFI